MVLLTHGTVSLGQADGKASTPAPKVTASVLSPNAHLHGPVDSERWGSDDEGCFSWGIREDSGRQSVHLHPLFIGCFGTVQPRLCIRVVWVGADGERLWRGQLIQATPRCTLLVLQVFPNYCHICRIPIRRSTKHCKVCEVCVCQYDHHCVFIGKCVAKDNLCMFKRFLLCISVVLAYALVS